MPNRKIVLVIDDDAGVRETVAVVLQDHYAVVEFSTADSAYTALMRGLHADAIVTDIHLPGTSGYKFIRKLRTDSRLASIPVVLLSADTNLEDMAAVIGAVALAKPCDAESLVTAVQSILPITA